MSSLIAAGRGSSRASVPRSRENRSARLPQSGIGIASLVIGLIVLIGNGLLIAFILTAAATWKSAPAEDSPVTYLVGGAIVVTAVLCLVGMVFAVGGLLQKQCRRGFALAGLLLNLGLPLADMALLIVAMTFNTHPVREKLPLYDAGAFHSPVAVVSRWLTIALAAMIIRRVIKRKGRGATHQSIAIPCPRCQKPLPPSVAFCRRCGCATL